MGFRREGLQRDGYFWDHRFHDFIMMAILEDEYRALRAAGRYGPPATSGKDGRNDG